MTNRKRGYLLILVAAVLYSTTEVVLKGLGDTFAPMQVTVERVLIGAVALLPFALKNLKKRNIRLTRSDYGYFALMGFLTVLLHMSLLQMAVLQMDASATARAAAEKSPAGHRAGGRGYSLHPESRAHGDQPARFFGDHHGYAAVRPIWHALQAACQPAWRHRDRGFQHPARWT